MNRENAITQVIEALNEIVAGVIEANRKSLDEYYLQSWASRLGLTDALLRADAPHDDSAG